MGKWFPLLLIFLLAILSGYAVYSALPYLPSNIQRIFSTPDSSSEASPSATLSPLPLPSPTPPESSFSNSLIITNYLQANLAIKGFAGDAFCAYDLFGNPQDHPSVLYLIFLCQEYYSQNGSILPGSGFSSALSLALTWSGEDFTINGHTLPDMGSKYAQSLKNIFSAEMVTYLNSPEYRNDINLLQTKVSTAVN